MFEGFHNMNRFSSQILAVVFVITVAFSSSAEVQKEVDIASPVINEILSELDDLRDILRDREGAKIQSSYFGKSKGDYTDDINDLLDNLFEVIVGDIYSQTREALLDIEDKLDEVDLQISALKIDRLTAPPSNVDLSILDKAMLREFSKGSKEDIDQLIAALDEQLGSLNIEKDDQIFSFIGSLQQKYGVNLSFEQARSALYQLNGSSMIESAAMFSVALQVEERVAEIRQIQSGKSTVLQRYYGVVAINRLLLLRMYERHLAQYEEDWLPRLEKLRLVTVSLTQKTEKSMSQVSNDSNRRSLSNNLSIQKLTLDTIDRYAQLLKDRERVIQEGLAVAQENALVSLNTLSTLENAIQLSDEILSNQSEFQALMAIETPQLIPLDDDEAADMFLSLSRELAGT